MILSIEAAIAGGSLSLVEDGREIAGWTGWSDSLRAERLMPGIDDLLNSAKIDRRELAAIAVSSGPGSFTGIRIALATALGLKAALGIPIVAASALEAIGFAYRHTGIVAAPVGRGGTAAQVFQNGIPLGQPYSVTLEDLFETAVTTELLLHPQIDPAGELGISHFDANIAFSIAKFAEQRRCTYTAPIFLSKN